MNQDEAGKHVSFGREAGGILQHIRFALLSKEQLAAEQASVSFSFKGEHKIDDHTLCCTVLSTCFRRLIS